MKMAAVEVLEMNFWWSLDFDDLGPACPNMMFGFIIRNSINHRHIIFGQKVISDKPSRLINIHFLIMRLIYNYLVETRIWFWLFISYHHPDSPMSFEGKVPADTSVIKVQSKRIKNIQKSTARWYSVFLTSFYAGWNCWSD